jgi:predicted metal-dependent phosphoesterase TrpH
LRVDLHIHTTESDGTWTPEELVREAARLGLKAIAVTDHDTTAGIRAAQDSAPQGLEVIPGIEINAAALDGADVHVVGLWIDPHDQALQDQLHILRKSRIERAKSILALLHRLGISLSVEDVLKYAHEDVVSRSHIASALLEKGVVATKAEAFERLIGESGPAYVPRYKIEPARAVQLILDAGGVPVLAHPGLLKNLDVLPILVDAGLVGLEVIHPSHNEAQQEFYLSLAEKFHLLPSGGSDCHGPGGKDEVYLGRYTIPEAWLHQLAARR